MKLHSLAAACSAAFALTSANPALAAGPVTATLATPVSEKLRLIAGGAVFICETDTCVARAAAPRTFATDTCRTIARKVGPLTAFAARRPLDEARLAACNAAARPAPD
ncbi:MAG: CC_3452 family protein [Phenylobacterium sp.]|uniref:CC_3452 family protein n=1 Tax=Phenylobacterium sp. TaxID=1871053 RepID=UPI00391B9D19